MNKEDLLWKYEVKLKSHDWYFQMSDDSRYWKAGQIEREEINAMINELKENGLLNEAIEIWEKNAPLAPYSEKKFPFPDHTTKQR